MLAGVGTRSTVGEAFTCINSCVFVVVLWLLWYCRNEPLVKARSAGWLAVSWILGLPMITVLVCVREWLGDTESSSAGVLFRCDVLIWLDNANVCAGAIGILISAYRLKVLIDLERAKIAWAKQQQHQTWNRTSISIHHHDDTTQGPSPPPQLPQEQPQRGSISLYLNNSTSDSSTGTRTVSPATKYHVMTEHPHTPLMNQHIKRSSISMDSTQNHECAIEIVHDKSHSTFIQAAPTTAIAMDPESAHAHERISSLATSLSNGALIRFTCMVCVPSLVFVPIFNATIYKDYQYQYGCDWSNLEWVPLVWSVTWVQLCGCKISYDLFQERARDAYGIAIALVGTSGYVSIISTTMSIVMLVQPHGEQSFNPLWGADVLILTWGMHQCVWPCYRSLCERAARQRALELKQQGHDAATKSGSKRTSVRVAPYSPDPRSRHNSISSHPLYTCLHDKDGYASFLKYAESAFSAENVLFWSAVHAYRAHPSTKHAKQVYETYIDPSSPLQVNLSGNIFRACQHAQTSDESKQVCVTLFDEALDEIFDMMKMDMWPRYLQSNDGKSYAHMASVPVQ